MKWVINNHTTFIFYTAAGTENGGIKKPVIIVGMAKKVNAKKKGELMEQNQDALEYSSEEEGEDLKDAIASINSKGKKVLLFRSYEHKYLLLLIRFRRLGLICQRLSFKIGQSKSRIYIDMLASLDFFI